MQWTRAASPDRRWTRPRLHRWILVPLTVGIMVAAILTVRWFVVHPEDTPDRDGMIIAGSAVTIDGGEEQVESGSSSAGGGTDTQSALSTEAAPPRPGRTECQDWIGRRFLTSVYSVKVDHPRARTVAEAANIGYTHVGPWYEKDRWTAGTAAAQTGLCTIFPVGLNRPINDLLDDPTTAQAAPSGAACAALHRVRRIHCRWPCPTLRFDRPRNREQRWGGLVPGS